MADWGYHPDRAGSGARFFTPVHTDGTGSHWRGGTLQGSWRAAVDGGTYGTAQRIERLMAEMMAFSELVIIEESMPTPQITVVSASSPISHST